MIARSTDPWAVDEARRAAQLALWHNHVLADWVCGTGAAQPIWDALNDRDGHRDRTGWSAEVVLDEARNQHDGLCVTFRYIDPEQRGTLDGEVLVFETERWC